ncbi:MAG: ACT domain-containing protein [Vulcanisaeta sp.]
MGNEFAIELTMSNEMNPLDAVVRALNVVRRGKVEVDRIIINMGNSLIKMTMVVRGEEDEVRWVCNKLDKLYDMVNVKYMPIELQVNTVVKSDGENIQR